MIIFGEIFESDLQEILENSQTSLQKLGQARILILGGTGFVGTWLVSALLYANEMLHLNLQVTVVTRNRTLAKARFQAGESLALKIVEDDLLHGGQEVGGEFTHLIHAATPSSPRTGGLDSHYVTDVSLNGAAYLLRVAKSQNLIPIFLHVSSGAVYGPQDLSTALLIESTSEYLDHSLMSPYALAKLEVERLVIEADAAGIVRGTNPRLFAFAGPYIDLDAHFAVGNFIHDALYSDRIMLKGNPKTVRSYLYPTDMVTWLLACITNPSLKPLHIGSDRPIEMHEAAEIISALTRGIPITSGNESSPISRYVPDTIKTRAYLGVKQEVSFEEAIERWVRWLKR